MIRVYAGDPQLTDEVRGWLQDVGFQFYGEGAINRGTKMTKGCRPEDVLVSVTKPTGDLYKKVVGSEQRDEVVLTLAKWGVKFPKKKGEGE
jgi:hypothetical protein